MLRWHVDGNFAGLGERRTGIGHVNDAVTQMDEVAQRNALLVEKAASSTSGLKQRSGTLVKALAVFKLKIDYSEPPANVPATNSPGKKARSAG